MQLRGAVAVVTGASAGIGWATAWAFARESATVVAVARRRDRLERLCEEIRSRGGRALAVPCDVSSWSEVEALARRVEDECARCDVLVNNAGVPGGGPFEQLSLEQIEEITGTNYMGVLYCTKALLPLMLRGGRGHIVNVGSLAGRFAVPGSSVYSSTKHAVVAFSEALHFELEPRGIRVTTVNPGLVATERFPHHDAIRAGRKVLKPEQIADLIVDVVKRGKAPEVSKPRLWAAAQAFRVLTPALYRFGLKRATRGAVRATRAGETDVR